MKKIAIILGLLSMSCYAADPSTAVLQHRGENNYAEASYSFYYGTHDAHITYNDYDILFQSNEIDMNSVVDNISGAVDLGKMNCSDIRNVYEKSGSGYPTKEDRKNHPMFWFAYSDAMVALQNGPLLTRFKPVEGHCYAMIKTTSRRKVITVFRVNKFVPDKFIELNEIEVFNKSRNVSLDIHDNYLRMKQEVLGNRASRMRS